MTSIGARLRMRPWVVALVVVAVVCAGAAGVVHLAGNTGETERADVGGLLSAAIANPGAGDPSPPNAARTAASAVAVLSGQADVVCERAAIDLIRHPQATAGMMREVLTESRSPRARAVAAVGLGTVLGRPGVEIDFEILTALVDSLEADALVVRTRAIWAVRKILRNRLIPYSPQASAQWRAEEIADIRREIQVAKELTALGRRMESHRKESR